MFTIEHQIKSLEYLRENVNDVYIDEINSLRQNYKRYKQMTDDSHTLDFFLEQQNRIEMIFNHLGESL